MTWRWPGGSMPIDDAIRIAQLWRAGKMIGGDEDDVRDALLAEVERLRKWRSYAINRLGVGPQLVAEIDAEAERPEHPPLPGQS